MPTTSGRHHSIAVSFSFYTLGLRSIFSPVAHISAKCIIAMSMAVGFNGKWFGIGVFGQHRRMGSRNGIGVRGTTVGIGSHQDMIRDRANWPTQALE